MKKTIIIICAVGALGLLHYGLNQRSQPSGLVPASSTKEGVMQGASNNQATIQPAATTYKDGTYTGSSEDNPYGTVQIAVVISGGKITGVNFLQMPSGRGHTDEVTAVAEPLLKQTTLSAQSSKIEFVSGATVTSQSYEMSLQSALDQAAS